MQQPVVQVVAAAVVATNQEKQELLEKEMPEPLEKRYRVQTQAAVVVAQVRLALQQAELLAVALRVVKVEMELHLQSPVLL
jgi:hypothetical protein